VPLFARLLLWCQYSYSCTSKASKLSTARAPKDAHERGEQRRQQRPCRLLPLLQTLRVRLAERVSYRRVAGELGKGEKKKRKKEGQKNKSASAIVGGRRGTRQAPSASVFVLVC
jgi:hypothetical protein